MKEKYEEIACDVVIFETLYDVIISSGNNTGSKSDVLGGNAS